MAYFFIISIFKVNLYIYMFTISGHICSKIRIYILLFVLFLLKKCDIMILQVICGVEPYVLYTIALHCEHLCNFSVYISKLNNLSP